MKLLISSANGRLGKSILDFALGLPEVEHVLAWVRSPAALNLVNEKLKVVSDIDGEVFEKSKCVFIEAGNASAFDSHWESASKLGLPMLVASTGLGKKAQERLGHYASLHPLVVAPNLSLGIASLVSVLSSLPKLLKDAHCEMIDVHHQHKKDAPSGTALSLAKALGKDISVHSIRGGDVIGEHQIQFFLSQEKIIISHEALSREVFAVGALRAATFLNKASPGMYSMSDVLKGS